MTEQKRLRPFVKWVGGKTQLLEKIKQRLPKQYGYYYEPFVGGGALFLALQPKNLTINDSNSELIAAYRCFQDHELYLKLIDKLDEHQQKHSSDYYFQIREMDRSPTYNELDVVERAARMIYLNKACFNGLYRVNASGYFNVPFGNKNTIVCYDRENFDKLHAYFTTSNIKILNGDYEAALKDVKEKDLVYLDPPYDPIEGKNSFISYGKDLFGKDAQLHLSEVMKNLTKRGAYVMQSNHNTAYINSLYQDFNINVVKAKRMVNSDGKGRGDVEEVIITNF